MAGDSQSATASPRKSSNESSRLGRLKRSLPKLITRFSRPKLGERSKTDDAVIRKDHGKPEAGPSKAPNRIRSSASGYHGDRSALSASTGQSVSIDWASRLGSSSNSDRNSESWTNVTTPEKTTAERFVPRPGIIPDTSSAEDERSSTGSSTDLMSSPYAPRISDGTPAESVRVHSEEVPPEQGLERNTEGVGLTKTASAPASTQDGSLAYWRSALSSKPDKGKGRACDYIKDVDGRVCRKNGDRKLTRPAAEIPVTQKALPVINPGHDTWAELSLQQKKKLSAKVNSNLSKYHWSAAEERKQPAVEEPIGPAGERAYKSSAFPDTLSRKEKESKMALPPVVTSVNGISTTRIVPAGLPAAVPEVEDDDELESDANSISSILSSAAGSRSGYSIASESSSSNLIPRQKPRDSTRVSRTVGGDMTHYSTGSIDLEALNSKHAKAADFEKFAKKKSSGSKKASAGTTANDDGEDGMQKLEMWRTNSKAEGAKFVICQSPDELKEREEVGLWW
ncbi:hypothetical protein CKM354_000211000 [Cercospora kikuchii]|uniref:Uncharacterized protein n=1 Tax=Cercospora kikuchii TaxID=84275 RepID=A0A9P3F9B4_9PEZI|nr:uncharacterized protein CKM354_000211000 [Cercospora kikuchii]GIZ38703.1 hypothetical protein CKM354_000211000 [Cercospora kikuchii]